MLQTRADALGHDGGLGALLGDVGHEGFKDVSLAPSGGVSTGKESAEGVGRVGQHTRNSPAESEQSCSHSCGQSSA